MLPFFTVIPYDSCCSYEVRIYLIVYSTTLRKTFPRCLLLAAAALFSIFCPCRPCDLCVIIIMPYCRVKIVELVAHDLNFLDLYSLTLMKNSTTQLLELSRITTTSTIHNPQYEINKHTYTTLLSPRTTPIQSSTAVPLHHNSVVPV